MTTPSLSSLAAAGIAVWLPLINLLAAAVTVWDKHAARHARRRVPERSLLLLALCGGSVLMYVTMLAIRHKTRKAKFMVGIPLIMAVQLAAWIAVTSLSS